jgi:hypothetical protein
VVLGDARPRLHEAPDATYDLIVLDAFSSDAVPVHLLTREALALYLAKLAPGGRLAFHISNQHLALDRVIAGLAADAGLPALLQRDRKLDRRRRCEHRYASDWAVMARRADDLSPLAADRRWRPAGVRPVLWTDDHAAVLPLLLP